MKESKELTDVTLVCDDKQQFKAHKLVLSACSSVFKSIINDLPEKSSVIYLKGINHQEMESILEFMYLGVATFYQQRMTEFFDVAKSLEIKEISKPLMFNFFEDSVNNQYESDKDYNDHKNTYDAVDINIMSKMEESSSLLQDTGNFHCNQCENQFTSKLGLKRHI